MSPPRKRGSVQQKKGPAMSQARVTRPSLELKTDVSRDGGSEKAYQPEVPKLPTSRPPVPVPRRRTSTSSTRTKSPPPLESSINVIETSNTTEAWPFSPPPESNTFSPISKSLTTQELSAKKVPTQEKPNERLQSKAIVPSPTRKLPKAPRGPFKTTLTLSSTPDVEEAPEELAPVTYPPPVPPRSSRPRPPIPTKPLKAPELLLRNIGRLGEEMHSDDRTLQALKSPLRPLPPPPPPPPKQETPKNEHSLERALARPPPPPPPPHIHISPELPPILDDPEEEIMESTVEDKEYLGDADTGTFYMACMWG